MYSVPPVVLGFVTCELIASHAYILKVAPLKEMNSLIAPGLAVAVVAINPEWTIVPSTSKRAPGEEVPIPTLPLACVITELPTVELPVNTGIFPDVPLPVTVCAVALTVNSISPYTSRRLLMRILASPLFIGLELTAKSFMRGTKWGLARPEATVFSATQHKITIYGNNIGPTET